MGDFGFFYGGRETGNTGEKPSKQDENQQQTQPTYATTPKSNPDLIGRTREL